MKEIETHSTTKKDMLRSAWRELESHGYAMSVKFHGYKGRTLYMFSETKDGMRQYFLENPAIAIQFYNEALHRGIGNKGRYKRFKFKTPPPLDDIKKQETISPF